MSETLAVKISDYTRMNRTPLVIKNVSALISERTLVLMSELMNFPYSKEDYIDWLTKSYTHNKRSISVLSTERCIVMGQVPFNIILKGIIDECSVGVSTSLPEPVYEGVEIVNLFDVYTKSLEIYSKYEKFILADGEKKWLLVSVVNHLLQRFMKLTIIGENITKDFTKVNLDKDIMIALSLWVKV